MTTPQAPIEVSYTKVVKIEDADGKAIFEGAVIREINDGQHGVVVWIGRPGSRDGPSMACVGDISVRLSPSHHRVTNRYSQWRHVPRNEQTYEERLVSWQIRPHDPYIDPDSDVSEDEALAVSGIMALLPADIVDWDYGPHPNRLEDALNFLQEHLTELEKKASSKP